MLEKWLRHYNAEHSSNRHQQADERTYISQDVSLVWRQWWQIDVNTFDYVHVRLMSARQVRPQLGWHSPANVRLILLDLRVHETDHKKKLIYRRETVRQLRTSFSARSLIVHFTEQRICCTTI